MRKAVIVLIADVVLLISLFFVAQDLQWRAAYAASPHYACPRLCSYSPSSGYNLLTRFFTMDGITQGQNIGQHLVSPPALDWVQVIALALVVVNVWFAYSSLTSRRKAKTLTSRP